MGLKLRELNALAHELVDIYTDKLIDELELREVVASHKTLAAVCSKLADEDFQLLADAQNAAEGAAWQRFRELYSLSGEEEDVLNALFQGERYEIGY
jgi:hypothetical protein